MSYARIPVIRIPPDNNPSSIRQLLIRWKRGPYANPQRLQEGTVIKFERDSPPFEDTQSTDITPVTKYRSESPPFGTPQEQYRTVFISELKRPDPPPVQPEQGRAPGTGINVTVDGSWNPLLTDPYQIEVDRSTSPSGPWTAVKTFTNPSGEESFTDGGASAGTLYYYRVRGKNALDDVSTYGPPIPAYDGVASDTLTVGSSSVPSNLTNFPVLLRFQDLSPEVRGAASPDGADIRVEDDSGNVIPREIVFLNRARGVGAIYFRAPSLTASSATTFTIKAGSGAAAPAPTDPNGRNAVWSNGFHRAYHFADDPSGGVVTDSTGNADATLTGSIESDAIAYRGSTGIEYLLDGQDDAIKIPISFNWFGSSAEFTFELVAQPLTQEDTYPLVQDHDGGQLQAPIEFSRSGEIFTSNQSSKPVRANYSSFERLAISMTHTSGGNFRFYVDGSEKANESYSFSQTEPPLDLTIGDPQTNLNYFPGYVGELLVSSVSRSPAWMQVRGENLRNRASFYTIT